jgi:hypothetical protein
LLLCSAADGEALDFEPEDDDLMYEDNAPDADASPPHPKLKSAIIQYPFIFFPNNSPSPVHHNHRVAFVFSVIADLGTSTVSSFNPNLLVNKCSLN